MPLSLTRTRLSQDVSRLSVRLSHFAVLCPNGRTSLLHGTVRTYAVYADICLLSITSLNSLRHYLWDYICNFKTKHCKLAASWCYIVVSERRFS